MKTLPFRRFLLLAAGSTVGGYICARFQFGLKFFAPFAEEFLIFCIVVGVAFAFTALMQLVSNFVE